MRAPFIFMLALPIAAISIATLAQPASPETPRLIPDPALIPAPDDHAALEREAIQRTIDALYAVISGPAGERDWQRFQSLFAENARLTHVVHRRDATVAVMSLTPAEFAERNGPFLKENPFFETEVSSRVETYANLAHVWSTYESRRAKDEAPFTRGINSIQLVKSTADDWKILAVTWDSEASGRPIPDYYLRD